MRTQYPFPIRAHEPFEGMGRDVRMTDHALPGRLPYQQVAIVIHPDHRGRQDLPQRVGDQFRFTGADNRYGTVGRAEINTYFHCPVLCWPVAMHKLQSRTLLIK